MSKEKYELQRKGDKTDQISEGEQINIFHRKQKE